MNRAILFILMLSCLAQAQAQVYDNPIMESVTKYDSDKRVKVTIDPASYQEFYVYWGTSTSCSYGSKFFAQKGYVYIDYVFLVQDSKNYFRVQGVDADKPLSPFTSTVSATIPAATVSPPSTPTGVAISPTTYPANGGSGTLTWNRVSAADYYEIKLTTPENSNTSKTNDESFDTLFSQYYAWQEYQVRAVNDGGTSNWSSTVKATRGESQTPIDPVVVDPVVVDPVVVDPVVEDPDSVPLDTIPQIVSSLPSSNDGVIDAVFGEKIILSAEAIDLCNDLVSAWFIFDGKTYTAVTSSPTGNISIMDEFIFQKPGTVFASAWFFDAQDNSVYHEWKFNVIVDPNKTDYADLIDSLIALSSLEGNDDAPYVWDGNGFKKFTPEEDGASLLDMVHCVLTGMCDGNPVGQNIVMAISFCPVLGDIADVWMTIGTSVVFVSNGVCYLFTGEEQYKKLRDEAGMATAFNAVFMLIPGGPLEPDNLYRNKKWIGRAMDYIKDFFIKDIRLKGDKLSFLKKFEDALPAPNDIKNTRAFYDSIKDISNDASFDGNVINYVKEGMVGGLLELSEGVRVSKYRTKVFKRTDGKLTLNSNDPLNLPSNVAGSSTDLDILSATTHGDLLLTDVLKGTSESKGITVEMMVNDADLIKELKKEIDLPLSAEVASLRVSMTGTMEQLTKTMMAAEIQSATDFIELEIEEINETSETPETPNTFSTDTTLLLDLINNHLIYSGPIFNVGKSGNQVAIMFNVSSEYYQHFVNNSQTITIERRKMTGIGYYREVQSSIVINKDAYVGVVDLAFPGWEYCDEYNMEVDRYNCLFNKLLEDNWVAQPTALNTESASGDSIGSSGGSSGGCFLNLFCK